MKANVRFLTVRRFENLQPWLPWAACSAALLFGTAVYGQATLPVPGTPPCCTARNSSRDPARPNR
jgi:hypothetical protein